LQKNLLTINLICDIPIPTSVYDWVSNPTVFGNL